MGPRSLVARAPCCSAAVHRVFLRRGAPRSLATVRRVDAVERLSPTFFYGGAARSAALLRLSAAFFYGGAARTPHIGGRAERCVVLRRGRRVVAERRVLSWRGAPRCVETVSRSLAEPRELLFFFLQFNLIIISIVFQINLLFSGQKTGQ